MELKVLEQKVLAEERGAEYSGASLAAEEVRAPLLQRRCLPAGQGTWHQARPRYIVHVPPDVSLFPVLFFTLGLAFDSTFPFHMLH